MTETCNEKSASHRLRSSLMRSNFRIAIMQYMRWMLSHCTPTQVKAENGVPENYGQDLYYYENIEGGHGGAADAKQQAFMTVRGFELLRFPLFNLESLKNNYHAVQKKI